jgi:hypothetical protein
MSFDTSPANRLGMSPTCPPAEVDQAMAVADQSYGELVAAGRALSFELDQTTSRVRVEVHDLEGNVLFTIPPSRALAIAAGESLA